MCDDDLTDGGESADPEMLQMCDGGLMAVDPEMLQMCGGGLMEVDPEMLQILRDDGK